MTYPGRPLASRAKRQSAPLPNTGARHPQVHKSILEHQQQGRVRWRREVSLLYKSSCDPNGLVPLVKEMGWLIAEPRKHQPPRARHVGEEDPSATPADRGSRSISVTIRTSRMGSVSGLEGPASLHLLHHRRHRGGVSSVVYPNARDTRSAGPEAVNLPRFVALMVRQSVRVTLGGYPPRVPTDPYVHALEHTVPQMEG